MYDYYDDYYDPSDAEIAMEEIQQILKKSLKLEIQTELEKLRKENEELREFRKEKDNYMMKLRSLESEYKVKLEQSERNARQQRIHDLLGDNICIGYSIGSHSERPPKCDKCNNNRQVEFTSPLGRKMKEDCTCAKYITTFNVQETELIKFYISRCGRNERVNRYYKHAHHTYNDRDDYNEYDLCYNIYKDEEFGEVNRYSVIFLDKNKAEEYCEWLNNKVKRND